VIAAAKDIKLGTVLSASDLTTVLIAGTPPKDAILKPEDAVGRGVTSDLYQGEPVMNSRLAALGAGGGLAASIRQGMRACAVKVDEVVGVAGFVIPGMRVDVLISGIPPSPTNAAQNQPAVERTILQNIEVLSAGTDIQKDAEGKPRQVQVVNLLVTPQDAETLALASNQTHIQLVLRNPLDTQIAQTPGTGMVNLFAGKDVVPVKPRIVRAAHVVANSAPQFDTVEVFNGSQRSETKFASHEEKQ
jgi:pilus assembly protein CpaB